MRDAVHGGGAPAVEHLGPRRQLTPDGVVDRDEDRRRAKEILGAIPGIRGVVNRVRVRTAAGKFAIAPGEISREIEERLRRAAEEAASGIPGITEVVNRLEVTA